jgi:hypothetical protein
MQAKVSITERSIATERAQEIRRDASGSTKTPGRSSGDVEFKKRI